MKKTLAIAGLTVLLVGLCPTPIRAQSYEDCIKSGKYLAGYPRSRRMAFSSFDDAVKECMKLGGTPGLSGCGGVTQEPADGKWTLRQGISLGDYAPENSATKSCFQDIEKKQRG